MSNAERREQIATELEQLLDTHGEDCAAGGLGCADVACPRNRALAILDYLQGAGLMWWGGRPEMATPPDNTGPLSAVRLSAELWWPMLPSTREGWTEVGSAYVYLPLVLGVVGLGPDGDQTASVVTVDNCTPEHVRATLPLVRQILERLERLEAGHVS